MPKGYKLLSPKDDAGLDDFYLEERRACSSVSNSCDWFSENFDAMKEMREATMKFEKKKEQARRAERQQELFLEERKLKLLEAKEKREAKKDRMMLKLMTKMARKLSEGGASCDQKLMTG